MPRYRVCTVKAQRPPFGTRRLRVRLSGSSPPAPARATWASGAGFLGESPGKRGGPRSFSCSRESTPSPPRFARHPSRRPCQSPLPASRSQALRPSRCPVSQTSGGAARLVAVALRRAPLTTSTVSICERDLSSRSLRASAGSFHHVFASLCKSLTWIFSNLILAAFVFTAVTEYLLKLHLC